MGYQLSKRSRAVTKFSVQYLCAVCFGLDPDWRACLPCKPAAPCESGSFTSHQTKLWHLNLQGSAEQSVNPIIEQGNSPTKVTAQNSIMQDQPVRRKVASALFRAIDSGIRLTLIRPRCASWRRGKYSAGSAWRSEPVACQAPPSRCASDSGNQSELASPARRPPKEHCPRGSEELFSTQASPRQYESPY